VATSRMFMTDAVSFRHLDDGLLEHRKLRCLARCRCSARSCRPAAAV
jgi:hypothetical protein